MKNRLISITVLAIEAALFVAWLGFGIEGAANVLVGVLWAACIIFTIVIPFAILGIVYGGEEVKSKIQQGDGNGPFFRFIGRLAALATVATLLWNGYIVISIYYAVVCFAVIIFNKAIRETKDTE